MMFEPEKFNTVVENFQHLIDTNRIVKDTELKMTHTVKLHELFSMFEEEHSGLLRKSEYFTYIRCIPSLRVGEGPSVISYGRADRPSPKAKASKVVEIVSSTGQCELCERSFTSAAGGANHAKATGHTVKVQTVLNTTFNPKA